MSSADGYFMDDPREAKRLADKVNPDGWARQYVVPLLDSATAILDVGCGPGVIACAVGRSKPSVSMTGIDLSTARIKTMGANLPPNVRLQQGDACQLLFADDSFDLVYCRFLLEYLKNKQDAVNEMVRVCRPGGKVLLQDLDGQLTWHFPEDEELQSPITRVLTALAKKGFDPFVGRKLFSMAKAANLVDVHVKLESYHLFAGEIDRDNLGYWETKLDIAMPMAAEVLGGEGAALALKERFLGYLRRSDTLTYSVVFTVLGTKPG